MQQTCKTKPSNIITELIWRFQPENMSQHTIAQLQTQSAWILLYSMKQHIKNHAAQEPLTPTQLIMQKSRPGCRAKSTTSPEYGRAKNNIQADVCKKKATVAIMGGMSTAL